jgi:hypothetical protein
MASSADKAPSPQSAATSDALWNATEGLKNQANEAFVDFTEGEGDLDLLVTQLGMIRDRADSIQTAAIQMADSIRSYL